MTPIQSTRANSLLAMTMKVGEGDCSYKRGPIMFKAINFVALTGRKGTLFLSLTTFSDFPRLQLCQ